MLKTLRIGIFLFFVLSDYNGIFAQNLFSSNLYSNLIFDNPALAGLNDYTVFQFNYRNHWPIDGIYNTYGAAAFHHIKNLNSNAGLVLNHDRQYQGYLSNTAIGANYAYRFRIAYRNYISLGLSGSYNFQNLNYNQLSFENQGVIPFGNQSNRFPLINAGAVFTYQKIHHFGLSVVNVYPFNEQAVIERKIGFSYFSHYDVPSYSALPGYFEPVVAVNISNDMLQFNYGLNLGLYNFKTGLHLSQTGINVNTTTFLLGILFDNYEFIYCYDLNLSTSITVNPKMAAHEVTFLNKFQYKGRSKKKGAIKCPKI